MKYPNPIIPGFYPGLSYWRVKDDYYLVTSFFEYLPGIPIFHGRDFLVHWQQIGHCLTQSDQLPLNYATPSEVRGLPDASYSLIQSNDLASDQEGATPRVAGNRITLEIPGSNGSLLTTRSSLND